MSKNKIDYSKFNSFPAAYTEECIRPNQKQNIDGFHFEKNSSPQANRIKHRYFFLESRLSESVNFCAPVKINENSCSLNNEFIIKESCSFIEILLKNISKELGKTLDRNTTICDLLALDSNLLLSRRKVQLIGVHDDWNPELVISPFDSLLPRCLETRPTPDQLPIWWKAYSELKHNPDSFAQHATQLNVFACLSALFILLHRIYGPGMVSGITKDNEGVLHFRKESSFFAPINFQTWSTFEYFKVNWKDDPNRA